MALKTFNLDAEVYKQFSAYCKKYGISMSKKIENYIRQELNRIKSTVPTSPESPKPTEGHLRKYVD